MRWLIVGGIVFWGVLVWIVGILTGMQLRSSHLPCGGGASRVDAGCGLPLRRRLSPSPTRVPFQTSSAVRPSSNVSLSAPAVTSCSRRDAWLLRVANSSATLNALALNHRFHIDFDQQARVCQAVNKQARATRVHPF